MTYTFVQSTVDTNRSQSDLAHLEGQRLHSHRAKVANEARNLINDLLAHIGEHHRNLLLKVDIDNPSADDEQLFDEILSNLTPQQVALLEDGFNDTIVVADGYANGMTRFDLPERTEGTITGAQDPSGLLPPEPGEQGSEHSSYKNWALDQITTILTGIHPVHGEVPIFKSGLIALLSNKRFRKVVKSTGLKVVDLYKAIDNLPDHPVEDDATDSYLSPHRLSRSPFSSLYPPPAPEDETPPEAVRPRPGNFQRGISMTQDTTDPYTNALHQATDLLRQAIAAPSEAERKALVRQARSLSRQIASYEESTKQFAALASRFTRRPRNAR